MIEKKNRVTEIITTYTLQILNYKKQKKAEK